MMNGFGGNPLQAVALLVAIAGAKSDQRVIEAAQAAIAALDATDETVARVKAMTPEQKQEELARRKALVQTLHDVACEWLEVDERSDVLASAINNAGKNAEPTIEGLDGFDFGSVFGDGLK